MAKESLAKQHARVRSIIATLKRTQPHAKLALNFSNALELLVALILAAQARDDLVNALTAELFRKHRTARAFTRCRILRRVHTAGDADAPTSPLTAPPGGVKN